LPFDIYCPEFETIDTPLGSFLPLEALLVATYEEFEVSRGVFTVLTELASLVPLYGSVCRPQQTDGLLVPGTESAGFRLNSIIPVSGRLYVDIGWQSPGQKYVFHTCICAFRPLPQGRIDTGCWESHAVIGVARLLARELRRRVPGSPAKMFSSSGWKVLQERASNEFHVDVLP